MNHDFIKKATRVTSFNLSTSDFQSLKYKEEIQHIFNLHFFPNFDMKYAVDRIEMDTINRAIDMLKREDNALFEKLHVYNLNGVGPGEATLFFLCNSAHLGGGSSAGVDIIASNGKFEVKAASISRNREAYNFKIGGTVPLTNIMKEMDTLRQKYKLVGNAGNINNSVLISIKRYAPEEYAHIESMYQDVVYDYFKNHKVIFINHNQSKADRGRIEAIKDVKRSDITIDVITSGTIKPKIKL